MIDELIQKQVEEVIREIKEILPSNPNCEYCEGLGAIPSGDYTTGGPVMDICPKCKGLASAEVIKKIEAHLVRSMQMVGEEIAQEIADGLAHLPIHGDMELMAREIKGFRKEVISRYSLTQKGEKS